MTRTKKQTHNGDERAALILELFRQLPDNKFSLRHLASASGGASKEGRRETMQIVEQLLATGVIESCPRDKYRLSPAQRPRLEGTVEMLNTGSMFVHVEGMEQQVYIHSRNSLNALDGDRVQLVLTRKARGSNAPEGEITAIVERSRKRYVGTAEVNEHNVFVRIDSRKMPVDVYLHKRDCPNVISGMQNPETKDRWVNTEWDIASPASDPKSLYEVMLQIFAENDIMLLANITTALADMKVTLLSINTKRRTENDIIINLTVGCKNIDHFNSIMSRLKSINHVHSIQRGFA